MGKSQFTEHQRDEGALGGVRLRETGQKLRQGCGADSAHGLQAAPPQPLLARRRQESRDPALLAHDADDARQRVQHSRVAPLQGGDESCQPRLAAQLPERQVHQGLRLRRADARAHPHQGDGGGLAGVAGLVLQAAEKYRQAPGVSQGAEAVVDRAPQQALLQQRPEHPERDRPADQRQRVQHGELEPEVAPLQHLEEFRQRLGVADFTEVFRRGDPHVGVAIVQRGDQQRQARVGAD